MSEYVVLSGIGPDRPGIARAISQAAYEAGCSIEDSRMAVLGGEFAILVLVQGDNKQIRDLSGKLPGLEKETGLSLSARPTSSAAEYKVEKGVPFHLQVVGMDRTGIVFRVTELLARHGINIESLETDAYNAPVAGTPMFRLSLDVEIPGQVQVRGIRKELAALCDELNMDFSMEARG
ncbi:MAG TPA: ACT domain-containing protein [Candidatus Glassbacteria bacterium]|nr:ACT domain-containing protein [Candidatus Glassbacteria bacterium]